MGSAVYAPERSQVALIAISGITLCTLSPKSVLVEQQDTLHLPVCGSKRILGHFYGLSVL